MQTKTLQFPHSTRAVYTAIRHLFEMRHTQFSGLKYNDDLFVIEARHGAWLSPFSERLKIKVAATGGNTCRVVIESSSRTILNLLNIGANKDNISDMSDYINNEVYKLQSVSIVNSQGQEVDHSQVRIVPPKIRFK